MTIQYTLHPETEKRLIWTRIKFPRWFNTDELTLQFNLYTEGNTFHLNTIEVNELEDTTPTPIKQGINEFAYKLFAPIFHELIEELGNINNLGAYTVEDIQTYITKRLKNTANKSYKHAFERLGHYIHYSFNRDNENMIAGIPDKVFQDIQETLIDVPKHIKPRYNGCDYEGYVHWDDETNEYILTGEKHPDKMNGLVMFQFKLENELMDTHYARVYNQKYPELTN